MLSKHFLFDSITKTYNKRKRLHKMQPFSLFVRMIGLEPTRLSSPDPKSGVATNYTTSAKTDDTKVREVYELGNKKLFF